MRNHDVGKQNAPIKCTLRTREILFYMLRACLEKRSDRHLTIHFRQICMSISKEKDILVL
jgi:hypothetical protein